MKKVIIAAFAALFAFGCQKGAVFSQYHKFNDDTWDRFDKVRFNIPNEDSDLNADIVFTLRHSARYPYDHLPLSIILTTPSGEERILEKDLKLKDEKGNFKGSADGDLWNYEEVLWPAFSFRDTGTYRVEFENLIPRMEIPGLVDIGLYSRKTN